MRLKIMRLKILFRYWIALAVASSCCVFAQRDMATLVGTVLDSSNASVPAALVVATNIDTNFAYKATSDLAGEWIISPVRIGTYRVTVASKGFKIAIAGPIALDVQQRQRVNVMLQPGEVTETVQVADAAPLLETDTSDRGQVVNASLLSGLPLNGRDAVQLAQLTAGVSVSEPGSRNEKTFGFTANGARSFENNFLLDGIDNNSNLPDMLNGANYVVMPSVDALQEFKVQTSNYNAEFGRATGAVVNATIKSGTNQVHGVLYEFVRNDTLDARNFFDAQRPAYKQNQFGADLGGAIIRDKLFAFGDYEGLRIRQAQTLTSEVPTQAQRVGDFSSNLNLSKPTGVPDCNGQMTYAGEIFDTRLTQASTSTATKFCGVPFGYNANGTPSNIIPASRLDPLGLKLINLFPLPNVVAGGYNYLSNPVTSQDRNQGDLRVDQMLSRADTAFYRVSAAQQPSIIPGPFSGLADGGGFFTGDEQVNGYSVAISETHVFSPTRINELKMGYNRLDARRFQSNSDEDVSGQIGFPGVPYAPGTNNGGLPQLTFNNSSTLGSPTYLPSIEIQNTYSFTDTVTLIHGSHTFKFGGEFRPEEFTYFQPQTSRGTMAFGTQFTDNAGNLGTGGNGLASMLAGQPTSGSITNLYNMDYLRKTYAGFVQDDWRMSHKLTVNLGLRYEFYGTVKERFNAQGNFNIITGQLDIPYNSSGSLTPYPYLTSVLPVNHNASDGLMKPDFKNFAPRVGFAYQITSKLVWRTAAGIFYNFDESGPMSHAGNPPFTLAENFTAACSLPSANPATTNCSPNGLVSLYNGFPANSLSNPNKPILTATYPNLVTPNVWQWNGTLEYQANSHNLFEIAYVGTKGTNLYIHPNVNQATPTANSSAPTGPRRPFPVDIKIGGYLTAGNSEYDGLQTTFRRRFSGGLTILMNYTYSHALGNASDAGMGSQNNNGFRWDADPQWEHGNLNFDVRQRFVANYMWEVPVGQGKRFGGNMSRGVNYVVGDWQISGITTASSGTWYTVTDSRGNFANSDGQQRPDLVAGQNPNGTPCVPGTFFNTCAFVNPPLGGVGNVGQNTILGPGVREWDLSALKQIRFTEQRRLEFRAEFFNIANQANFLVAPSGPQSSNTSTVLGSSSFGLLTYARPPRQIQFGLKFYF